MSLLRTTAVHQIGIAVQRKLLMGGGTAARYALVAVLVTDSRLPALDCILAEVGVGRRVGAVGWFTAVAFISMIIRSR